jgi:hypothetical protein
MTLSEALLFLRFTLGWPAVAVSGFVLGTVALGRLRSMTNGRRRLYRPLVSVAFGLCWTGSWGVLGVWQFSDFLLPLPVPLAVVSASFSLGVVWIGLSLMALAAVVLLEEFRHSGVSNHG